MAELADTTLVDGRYRIVERIGSGGMADVYRAEDTHLGRDVAIKVLHRRFAQDQEFVERFRREASAAAALQHPNVVNVFDRGEHDGTYYIAMEHLAGRTLKEIVRAEGALPQGPAIDLGVQILHAAGFAHKRGVIHRDFKSHNVIVDGEGNAKVTDFGIARAGASEMTETGSIMGTAQYLSPEQAQGQGVTAASDIYSIGVILYEMLTGRLPFEGDSAVSVALKHLSEAPVPIAQLRPDVDPNLESVVMAALAKDPAHRWQDADELAVALESVRAALGTGGNGQDTAAFAPVPMPVPVPQPEAPAAEPVAADGAPPAEAEGPPEERRRRWPMFTIGVMTLALAALLAYLAISGLLAGPKADMPNVIGKQQAQAETILRRAGFEEIEVRQQRSPNDFGEVIGQDPSPGDRAPTDEPVRLTVSVGPGNVRVPSVEALPLERAVRELNKADLKVDVDREASDQVRSGFAIRTVPGEGTEVERGTRVRLFVSSGPERVAVPGVIGQTRESAESEIENAGLDVAAQERESSEPAGEVIEQSPPAGTRVEKGSRVTIVVSTGEEKVQVPNVVGLSAGDAARQLRADGLRAVQRERAVDSAEEDGVVIDQRPSAGADVDKGRAVVIVVGRFEEPPPDETGEPPGGAGPPAP
jgi:beta-lactam-binding protein with PASTA domain/tRNA A-37 threonylcarbamoyl transferase component Bud32